MSPHSRLEGIDAREIDEFESRHWLPLAISPLRFFFSYFHLSYLSMLAVFFFIYRYSLFRGIIF